MFAFGFPFLAIGIKWAKWFAFLVAHLVPFSRLMQWFAFLVAHLVPFSRLMQMGRPAGHKRPFFSSPSDTIVANLRRICPSSSPPSHRPHTEGPNVSPSVTGVLGGRRKATSVGTGGDAPSHPRPHFYSPSSVQLLPQMAIPTNASRASILPPPTSPTMGRSAQFASSTASPASHDAYKSRCLPFNNCKKGR